MSILIKSIGKPERCGFCPFYDWDHELCDVSDKTVKYYEQRADCPLIELPPHGRLIDADALHRLFEDQWHYLQVLDWNENPTAEANQSGINWCINTMHDNAPTIIPAEEGE